MTTLDRLINDHQEMSPEQPDDDDGWWEDEHGWLHRGDRAVRVGDIMVMCDVRREDYSLLSLTLGRVVFVEPSGFWVRPKRQTDRAHIWHCSGKHRFPGPPFKYEIEKALAVSVEFKYNPEMDKEISFA